jgi:hypothetical protein
LSPRGRIAVPPLLYTPARLLVLLLAAELALLAPARAKLPFIGNLLERPARVPPPGPSAPPTPGSTPEALFQQQLRTADLSTLNRACQEAADFNFTKRLQLLRERLLTAAPAPQPLAVVLVNANALLSCKAPEAALTVLNRYGPKAGPERDQWLIQRWRAANASLQHGLAAESLQWLARGQSANLETIALPLRLRDDGSLLTRSALDALADHLVALGRDQEAAAVLLSGRITGQPEAERLQRASALLAQLPVAEREQLLETALDQAAAAGAWGLAAALLNDQRDLLEASGASSERARQRLRKLSQRVDDAYSEWLATRQDPQQGVRAAQLQQQLRSPRVPGGHATSQP